MSYEAWRCTFQSSEQAARAAFKQINQLRRQLEMIRAMVGGDDIECDTDTQVSDYIQFESEAREQLAVQNKRLQADIDTQQQMLDSQHERFCQLAAKNKSLCELIRSGNAYNDYPRMRAILEQPFADSLAEHDAATVHELLSKPEMMLWLGDAGRRFADQWLQDRAARPAT